jgi:cell division protein FtsB
MDGALKELISKIADPTILALLFIVAVLAYLLVQALHRVDSLSRQLQENNVTLTKLTQLVHQLVYGVRNK